MTTDAADHHTVEDRQDAVAWDAAATTTRSRPRPTRAAAAAAAVRADAAATAAEELQRALRSLEERSGLDERDRAVLRTLASRIVDGIVGAHAGNGVDFNDRVTGFEDLAADRVDPVTVDSVLDLFDVDAPASGPADDELGATPEVDDVE
jgi:hypothetical protein